MSNWTADEASKWADTWVQQTASCRPATSPRLPPYRAHCARLEKNWRKCVSALTRLTASGKGEKNE